MSHVSLFTLLHSRLTVAVQRKLNVFNDEAKSTQRAMKISSVVTESVRPLDGGSCAPVLTVWMQNGGEVEGFITILSCFSPSPLSSFSLVMAK